MDSQYAPLPVVSRYLTAQFFSIFVPVIVGLVFLYIVIDTFDRMNVLLRYEATLGQAVRYFLFKIPLMLTHITPPAVVVAVLLSLGLASLRHEVIALRAGGVSLFQTAVPIVAVSLLISVAALVWNETVVPYSSRMFQYVNDVEIRKRGQRGILSDREIWYHGSDGFYSIDYVDRSGSRVYGLLIYQLASAADGFRLHSVVEIPEAEWTGERWKISEKSLRYALDGPEPSARPLHANSLEITETLEDFLEIQREPEELSYAALRDRIENLTRKGIDASHYLVDLHLKLALPFANAVLAFVSIPIGGGLRRHPSMAAIVGLGTLLGFAYWVILGLGMSLGESGIIPPVVAAWSANGIYVLLGSALLLYSE